MLKLNHSSSNLRLKKKKWRSNQDLHSIYHRSARLAGKRFITLERYTMNLLVETQTCCPPILRTWGGGGGRRPRLTFCRNNFLHNLQLYSPTHKKLQINTIFPISRGVKKNKINPVSFLPNCFLGKEIYPYTLN